MPFSQHAGRRCRAITTLALAALLVTTLSSGSQGAEVDTDLEAFGSRGAAEQRVESSPTLVKLPDPPPRASVPQDRYAMAGGCYALQAPDDRWVVTSGGGYAATGDDLATAAPIHFQATELGAYLLFDADRQFIARSGGGVSPADAPSEGAEWIVTDDGDAFQIGDMAVQPDGSIGTGSPSDLRLRQTDGCAAWPEAEVNVTGQTFAGTSPIQEVRGYLDDHIHHMTPGFLGGGIHCGKPWDKYGVEYALKDCADHETADGQAALPEIVLSGNNSHDPTGWPTFKDWPAPDSLTHEGTYYRWVERAWRGGQRLFVNLLVENSVLCQIYPGPPEQKTKCNDMDSIRAQARESREFENYVDAQWGGPGKGWYRVVDSPAEARRVINAGKMAVVLGTESSNLFGCTNLFDQPQCTEAQIDAGLDELHELGIRQMVPTHKFDNAFAGAKGDSGFNGLATNAGTFIQNGSFFDMKTCEDGAPTDNTQLNPTEIPEEDVTGILTDLFGTASDLNALPTKLPLYDKGPHCNQRGLTDTGRYMLEQMVARNIIYDVDHLSVKSASDALDELEDLAYSGVISSHTWTDPSAESRVYALGGMVNPYAGGSTGYAGKWEVLQDKMDGKFYWGFGFGADMNGLGAQGDARENNAENPVTYPFTGMGGVTIDQQVAGERVFDINTDGVAQYGLYPDWIEDLRLIAGRDIIADLQRGPEAYLAMWERANGITNDACRQPELRRQASEFAAITAGTTSDEVLAGFGQPHLRRGSTYRYCALDGDQDATMVITFDGASEVEQVSTGIDDDETDPDPGSGPGTDPGDDDGADQEGADAPTALADQTDEGLPDSGGPGLANLILGLIALLIGLAIVINTRRLRPHQP